MSDILINGKEVSQANKNVLHDAVDLYCDIAHGRLNRLDLDIIQMHYGQSDFTKKHRRLKRLFRNADDILDLDRARCSTFSTRSLYLLSVLEDDKERESIMEGEIKIIESLNEVFGLKE